MKKKRWTAPRTTREGMTWIEWRQAATHGCRGREPGEAKLLRGFRAGHDPTDYAAEAQGARR